MRLLSPKEVKSKGQTQEAVERARLVLLDEELARKQKFLNTIVDGVDRDKENALKEFESFKAHVAQNKSDLLSSISILLPSPSMKSSI